jgi:hypothetical protein
VNLPSEIWVQALIRRANLEGAMAVITRKGDPRAGSAIIRVWNSRAGEERLYSEALDANGGTRWIEPVSEPTSEARALYVERAVRRDPDLWIVDIEDLTGRHFLTEPVEKR